jgi:signal peptidase I
VSARRSEGLAAVMLPAAVALLTIVGTLVLAASVPMLLGWRPTVVASASMAPALRPGDVLVSQPVQELGGPAAVQVRQIVLVDEPAHPGRLLSHRVQSRNADGSLVTKGDANAAADSTPVGPAHVLAVGRLVVPRIGLPVLWVRERDPRSLLAVVVLVSAIVLVRQPSRRPA